MTVEEPTQPADVVKAVDRLSLAIGRVVQSDVALEWQLRHLYQTLCGPSLASTVVPVGFGSVHGACRTMIEMADLSAPWDEVTTALLGEVAVLHGLRNRLVHDRFLLRMDQPAAEWSEPRLSAHRIRPNALRMTVANHELTELEALPDQIRRVVNRLNSLCLALPNLATYLLPGPLPDWDEEQDLRWVRGEFDIVEDGGMRLRDLDV